MGKLTPAERRRVFLIQEHNRQAMLARVSADPAAELDHGGASRRRQQRLLKTVLIFTLLSGGLALYELVEFHRPASVVEALLPRR